MSAQEKVIDLQEKVAARAGKSEILPHIVYGSQILIDCLNEALDAAQTNYTVLIQGETGVGKERLALLIHEQSNRGNKGLTIVDCATLQESLIISALFGHRRGAFTGAEKDKRGYFELADGGTIFLDEIGELPTEVQMRLLRVLQEGTFTPLGGTKALQVNVRVIAATNQNLEQKVAEGTFRSDLFYRLNQFPISVPSLRERPEDIDVLANHFKDEAIRKSGQVRFVGISEKAVSLMRTFHWPGNVRQLENTIGLALVRCKGNEILPKHLELNQARSSGKKTSIIFGTLEDMLNQFKRNVVLYALKMRGGNRSKAAKDLDIQRTYLSRLISKFEIKDMEVEAFPAEQFMEGLTFNPIEKFKEIGKLEDEIVRLEKALAEKTGAAADAEKLVELEEKVAELKQQLKTANQERAEFKERVAELEQRLDTEKQARISAEKQLQKALEANRRVETLGIEDQFLQLDGAREFKGKFPGIVLGETTLAEALRYGSVGQLVVNLRATDGNVKEAAELASVSAASINNRKKALRDQHGIDVMKLLNDESFQAPNTSPKVKAQDIATEIRLQYLKLAFRFALGEIADVVKILGISTACNCNKMLRKHGFGEEIITDLDRELYQKRKRAEMIRVFYDPQETDPEKLRVALAEMSATVDELQHTVAVREEELKQLRRDQEMLDRLREQQAAQSKQGDDKRVTELQQSVRTQTERLTERRKEIDELKQKLEQAEAALKKALSDKEQALADLKKSSRLEVARLKSDLEKARAATAEAVAAIKKELAGKSADAEVKLAKATELESRFEDLTKQAELLEKAKDAAEDEALVEAEKAEDLEAQLETEKAAALETRQGLASLQTESQEKISALEQRIGELQAKLKTVTDLQKALGQRDKELGKQQQKMAAMRQQIAELKANKKTGLGALFGSKPDPKKKKKKRG